MDYGDQDDIRVVTRKEAERLRERARATYQSMVDDPTASPAAREYARAQLNAIIDDKDAVACTYCGSADLLSPYLGDPARCSDCGRSFNGRRGGRKVT